MCTQNAHAVNEEYHPCHPNRRNRRDGHCGRAYSSTRAWPERGDSHSYMRPECYSLSRSRKNIEVRCLVANHSVSAVKCRHIICLLLAYFAISTSAEGTNYTESSSVVLPNLTRQQHVSAPDQKNASIPLQESQSVQTKFESTPTSISKSTEDTFSASEGYTFSSLKERTSEDHQKPAALQPSLSENISDIAEEESRYFILNLFNRYSTNDYFLKTDFHKMLVNIGLAHALNNSGVGLIDRDSHHNKHFSEVDTLLGRAARAHHNTTDIYPTSPDVQQQESRDERVENVTNFGTVSSHVGRQKRKITHQHEEHNKCLSSDELLQFFRYDKLKQLNADDFLHLCPALIDQLDAGYCKQSGPAVRNQGLQQSGTDSNHNKDEHHTEDEHHMDHHLHKHDPGDKMKHDTQEQHDNGAVPPAVWFYALLSVAVISLCSMAGVVVIPNMKRVFYNHILQFLVALAVGAMSGDAMLHLLPHAMLSESHHHSHDHQHQDVVNQNTTSNPQSHDFEDSTEKSNHTVGLYKGLVALLGIYSFFFLERLFTLFTRNRSGRSKGVHKPRRCRKGHKQRNQEFHMVNSKLENDGGNTPSCDEMVMVVHPNKALRAYADVSHEAYLHRCDESLAHPQSGYSVTTIQPQRDERTIKEESISLEGVTNLGVAVWNIDGVPAVTPNAEIVGFAKDAETVQSIQSHSHSHLAPDFVGSLNSVAMMIIVGDMIHNFCDGLAIGAAYAGNVAGGLSTSVAVFCHELPHEIGDFAVLVRSGLTMKQAVYFNLISSVPCFIGVIIGLAVGNVTSASSWIFAGVGGMFLYVTLVDLIPEMSSVYTKCGEPWFLHLLLQANGIAVGTTIMLIISVYEESLLKAFS